MKTEIKRIKASELGIGDRFKLDRPDCAVRRAKHVDASGSVTFIECGVVTVTELYIIDSTELVCLYGNGQ